MLCIKGTIKRFFGKRFFLWLILLWVQALAAQELPPLRAYVVVDSVHQRLLLAQNEHERFPPASLTKLMTAYLTFEALQNNKIQLDQKLTVSALARQQDGSRMFLEAGQQVSVDDLLRGLIIQSGNDASIVLAQHLAPSVADFVALMNQKALQLGMNNSHFMNPNGLPDEQHYSSAYDLALLAQALIRNFPQYYHYYQEKSFTFNKIAQNNRNRLLWTRPSVDGLKTGHTQAAGYCLVSSEAREKERLVVVVLGAAKEAQRYQATEALLNRAWAQHQTLRLVQKNQALQELPVYYGRVNHATVYAAQDLDLSLWAQDRDKIQAHLNIQHLEAPLAAGAEVGRLSVSLNGQTLAQVPIVIDEALEETHFVKRFWHGLQLWWAD